MDAANMRLRRRAAAHRKWLAATAFPYAILVLTISSTVALAAGKNSGAEARRPNVVVILTDDQGIGDFGVMGNPVIETPHIDNFAAQSAAMDRFYVSPVCAPTRASLMTGRYNYRTRVVDTYLGRAMMEPEETTIADLLSGAGYATGIYGKWHLGDNFPERPQDQGFQESLIIRGGGLVQPCDPLESAGQYTDPILFCNGRQVASKGYCTDVYFAAAMDFIQHSHDNNRPFFAYIATNAPHYPFNDVPADLLEKYKRKDMSALLTRQMTADEQAQNTDDLTRIAAMITNIDDNVGRLLKQLEELSIADDTLVIFLCDNGPGTERYVAGLRGMKCTIYDGGIRSPLWLRWPGRIEAGSTCGEISAHIDLMPTILDACQVALPTDLKLDGRSLMPLLWGDKNSWADRYLVAQSHRGDVPQRYHNFMIRSSRWKLLNSSGFDLQALPAEPKFELYDMQQDPRETNDVAGEHPDVVGELRAAYDAWFDDVSSTRDDNYDPPKIFVGDPQESPTVLTRQQWRGGSRDALVNGYWGLYVARDGLYDVTMHFDPSPTEETATLMLGDRTLKEQIPAASTSCKFSEIRLQQGNLRLQGALVAGENSRSVYQVYVEREP